MRDTIITTAVIGDALGRSCEGLSRGHLKEHSGKSDNYIDPYPMLKGKMDRWTMPGLYSSQAQVMLLAAFSSVSGYFNKRQFIDLISGGMERGPGEFGIFRNPPFFIRNLIRGLSDPGTFESHHAVCTSGLLPVAAPLTFNSLSMQKLMQDVISLSLIFHADPASTAAALSFSCFLHRIINGERPAPADILRAAARSNQTILSDLESSSAEIFKMGMNPETLGHELERMGRLLDTLSESKNAEHGEKTICDEANRTLKTPLTRATVDHPLTVYPHGLLIISSWTNETGGLLHVCARQGGAAITLTSLAGIIASALTGNSICPKALVDGLVNRKMIFSIAEAFADNAVPGSLPGEYLDAEAGLTRKEIEERNAKMKHGKSGDGKTKESRQNKQDRLTRHVVESWTKLDKAKWKKERKKHE